MAADGSIWPKFWKNNRTAVSTDALKMANVSIGQRENSLVQNYPSSATADYHTEKRQNDQEEPLLLSNFAIKWMRIGLKFSTFWGSIPYKWTKDSENFGKPASFMGGPFRKFVCALHSLVYIFYLIFVFCRWIQLILSPHEGVYSPRALGALYIFCTYSLVPAIQWSVWSHYGQHHKWINIFFNYNQQFRAHNQMYHVQHDKFYDCATDLRFYTGAFILINLLDMMSLLENPDQPYFISSLIGSTKSDQCGQKILFLLAIIFHQDIWFHMYATLFFFIFPLLSHTTVMRNSLHKLFRPRQKNRAGQNCEKFVTEIRKLEIIQGFFNHLWSTTIACHETAILLGTILSYYGAVKLGGARGAQQVTVAIILTYHQINLLTNLGKVFENSSKVFEYWRMECVGNALFRRQLRAMRTVRVNVGGFFFADRSLKLTILAITLENTATLLLSTA